MLMWRLCRLPEPEAFFDGIMVLFQKHSLAIVAVSAFVEGLVLINLYFPGSVVIILGVLSQRDNPVSAGVVVALAVLGFSLAACLNYALGYYGVYSIIARLGGRVWLERAHDWHLRHGRNAILMSYVHPNVGAFVAVASGKARYSFVSFVCFACIGIGMWSCVWGIMTYHFGQFVKTVATQPELILGGLILWSFSTFLFAWSRHSPQRVVHGVTSSDDRSHHL